MQPRIRQFLTILCFALCLFGSTSLRAQTIPPFVTYHEATDAQHQSYWNTLRPQGYRLISLSVHGDPANERYAAVWVKRTGPLQAAIHNTNAAGYQSFFNTVTQEGYRPVIVSATGPRESATFAAVFEKSSSPGWLAIHDLFSGDEYNSGSVQYWMKYAKENGFIPISLSRYGNFSNDARYAGIWVNNVGNTVWAFSDGPFASSYQNEFNAYTGMDMRPACIGVSNGQRYSAVFYDDRIGPYVATHDLTSQQYQDFFLARKAEGYYPIIVEGSGIGTGARFAAVFAKRDIPLPRTWRVSGAATSYLSATDTAKFDTIIKNFMQLHGVRAGQFAYRRNNRLAYNRAFTWAESTYPTTTTSSPMRLASNSKAFACAAIDKLSKSHRDLMSRAVFPLLGITEKALGSQTPSSYIDTITIQNLVEHKGGWDIDFSNFDPVFNCREISVKLGITDQPLSAWNMARFMYGEPLQFVPGARDRYSNFGYVLLGLVVEKLSGKTFEQYVKEDVLTPAGIGSVWQASTSRDERLPGEGFYHDPAIGADPADPSIYTLVGGPYGGGGYLTEAMHGGGCMAATASSMSLFASKFAIWGIGGRNAGSYRTGSMHGTSSLTASRGDGADYAFIFNTRKWRKAGPDPVELLKDELSEVMANIKPTLSSLSTYPGKLAGGQSMNARVVLNWEAPAGGAVLSVSSSNTAAATVPATVTIAAGQTLADIPIKTYPQTTNAVTTIKVIYNGSTKTASLTVTPVTAKALALTYTSVYGGTSVTGILVVNGTAAVDTTVTLSSTNIAAHPAAQVVIPAGGNMASFPITTDPVTANTTGSITATVNGTYKSVSLTVKAPVLSSLTLTPNPVKGGTMVNGVVAMSSPVAQETTLNLSSANSKAIFENGTKTMSIVIPTGGTKASFAMKTAATTTNVSGYVSATLGLTVKKVYLTVTP